MMSREARITDEAVNAAAKAMADSIGHGMREKTYDHARAALEAALPHLSQGAVRDASYTEMLIDNAATASQNTALVDDPVIREAIRLNIIDPLLALSSHEPAPTDTQDPAFDFYAHLKRQREWSEKTFGPGPRALGVIDHIRKELLEIEADPNDISEWIDVAILALDGAWRAGYQPQEIIDALIAKQTKNEGRQWPDWRTMPTDKAIEHDRSTDTQEGLSEAGEVVAWAWAYLGSRHIAFDFEPDRRSIELGQLTDIHPLVRLSTLTACRDECFKRLQEAERLSYELTACQQEVERLRKDYDAACDEAAKSYIDKCSAEARNAELVKALEPFVRHLNEMRFDLDHEGNELPGEQTCGCVYLTLADFRRARAVLEQGKVDAG